MAAAAAAALAAAADGDDYEEEEEFVAQSGYGGASAGPGEDEGREARDMDDY
jgi:hypothetical protein